MERGVESFHEVRVGVLLDGVGKVPADGGVDEEAENVDDGVNCGAQVQMELRQQKMRHKRSRKCRSAVAEPAASRLTRSPTFP